jgi:hypothetical protein
MVSIESVKSSENGGTMRLWQEKVEVRVPVVVFRVVVGVVVLAIVVVLQMMTVHGWTFWSW